MKVDPISSSQRKMVQLPLLAMLAALVVGYIGEQKTPAQSIQAQTDRTFLLSVPAPGSTNEALKPTVAWRRPEPGSDKKIIGYTVEIADDSQFSKNSERFDVEPSSKPHYDFEEELHPGRTYYWRVYAWLSPNPDRKPRECPANSDCLKLIATDRDGSTTYRTFTTTYPLFSRLENAGFTLQRSVAGDDATEGAQFAFTRTLGKGLKPDQDRTVYNADFALIWRHSGPLHAGRTFYRPELSAEGTLTSEDNKAEDAWRFRGKVVITTSFVDYQPERTTRLHREKLAPAKGVPCGFIDGLYYSVGAKYESTQDFETAKIILENIITPTSRRLGWGFAKPGTECGGSKSPEAAPVQFMWRPFFGVDYGRTINLGESAEKKDTVLRLVPRVRAQLMLNFLRRALNLQQTFFYVDETFYNLPLEDTAKKHNLFVSGFELDFNENLGIGFEYKKGSSAPKFEYGNTFGGTITMKFGQ